MVRLPEFLNPFRKKAEALLAEHAIKNIEFSGRTYQVQVVDPKSREEAWAFLQLDEKGEIKDSFCSCEAIEEASACSHLAAAYLHIFRRKGIPLHERFQRSLWSCLAVLYADGCGEDIKVIKKEDEGVFSCRIKGNERVFTAKGLSSFGKTKLREIFVERPMETEETSLKFSNLSEEEIRRWRQGRPSSQLRYELSFWNDLAKWLMLMQDEGVEYQIVFSYSPQGIPTRIQIRFADVEVCFHLSENDLSSILPALATVKSPLVVRRTPPDSIQRIVYDKDAGELKIEPQEVPYEERRKLEEKGLLFGDWRLIPGECIYSQKEHPLLKRPVFKGREIGKILSKYFSLIKSKLADITIFEESIELSYSIQFDSDWNLHINGYLFEPEDLGLPYSRFFGDWAYLDGKGFFHLEHVVFDDAETIVPCGEVGDFIRKHRAWFNRQEGFAIHITGVETRLDYTLTEEDCLLFTRKALIDEEPAKAKDFGQWVYVKDLGFFSKVSSPEGIPIRGGVKIKPDQISLFLRMYAEELQLISGFFSSKSPIAKMGLRIEYIEKQAISITPEYKRYPQYEGREIKIFEDYTYVEGEGFHKIPQEILLPVRFRYPIRLEKESFPRFFTYEMDQLQAFATFIDPRLSPPKYLRLIAETLSPEAEGYKLKLHYASEKDTVAFSEIWTAIHGRERFFFSEAGLIDLAEDRFKWIAKIKKNQIDRRGNKLTLSTLDLLRLNAFDEIHVEEGGEHLKELAEFRLSVKPDISGLKSRLRGYQELGLQWLWFLYRHNLSGLLCDDMGLGKTHQAMALMAAVMNYNKEKKHFLVVCPTSVIYHWEEKLNEFLPAARVCTFHGSSRSLGDFHKEYDVLLTSYGIWRNEYAVLKDVLFEAAIFDEIQSAKNQKSRIHASLLSVKARMRIGLTGTPIENRLRELKALFDIILPNFMPGEAEYRQFFVIPIEKENDLARKRFLSRYIKPFVLRRKKEEVLLDLPEKTEEVVHCELSADQRLLYQDVLHKVRDGIVRELEDRSAPIPYIHVFSALSSLKQICNHPAAYLKNPLAYPDYRSGKWDLFVELLNEALESCQKVVVFSQYLRMLDIIEQHLHENAIGYAAIRGATLDRGEQVRRFNKDPSCRVFLGSLQAAGLGIDLTAGSVVIHYDRWWNAAREDQATDRVHRIGQIRGVQVFKLVTKGTFEERIDEMILQKGKLMEEVVGVDDHRFMKHFDRDELLQLLKDI